jgi:hypothetical protein
MPDINSGAVTRFESGGTLTITEGATDYTVLNIEPGTLRVMPGGTTKHAYTDRGLQKQPILGDRQPSEIEVEMKIAGGSIEDATGILALSKKDDTTNGLGAEFTVKVFVPDKAYTATGNTMTFTNCRFEKPAEYSAGTDFDKLRIKFISRDKDGTVAAI